MKNSELTWLPLSHRKGLPFLPKVIVIPNSGQKYGGYYNPSTQEIVAVYSTDENLPATLAHEFKHFTQHLTDKLFPIKWEVTSSYNLAIRSYFRSSKSEFEALLFEHKVSKTVVNNFWLKGLVLPHSIDLNLEM